MDFMNKINAVGYYFVEANAPLDKRNFSIDTLANDQVVVEVAGCGLCHTDLSFLSGAVKTKHELPLILGHEISGKVVAAGDAFSKMVGKNVIIPAVLPCGECELCHDGRDNICQNQKMPGNDFNGGFASHIVVPGRWLCALPDNLCGFKPAQFSVVADAVTTPYQSLLRSHLKKGDVAIVIGVGGIGTYMVQHAKIAGATVIAVDISEKRLQVIKAQGADHTICCAGIAEKEVKDQVKNFLGKNKLPKYQWKIFETSGTAAGQNLAFSLLTYAGVLGVIGFTMDKISIRLSNVMAFDADVFGNWGCGPSHYPAVVKQVLEKKINLLDNIQEFPMEAINDVILQAREHKLEKRAILMPK
jgi:6-hydroxycyclohex-1-ene-1-carbonyl-CoA dehydrogenase